MATSKAYAGCQWESVPVSSDRFHVQVAMRELYYTRLVRREYPCISAIVQFLSIGVTQSVLSQPNAARLISLTRRIIDSLVTVGYVAIYLNSLTNQLDVVSPFVYLAVTHNEYKILTGKLPPRKARKRAEMKQLVETHVTYFPEFSEEELHYHPKFGHPIVFMGDWEPDHGVPTTPCHNAYNSLETRRNLIGATKVTAARNMQPATGFVMTQPIGGIAGALNSINSITGAIGPTEVLDVYNRQVGSVREQQRKELEESRRQLQTQSVSGELIDEISAVVQPAGDGHMAWVPQPAITGLDVGKQFDTMVSEVAASYQIPADALNLLIVKEKSAHTTLREAHKVYTTISSMSNHVQMIIDQCRMVATDVTAGNVILPEGDLKPSVPAEILFEMNKTLSEEGRVELFADMLRVEKRMIEKRPLEEIIEEMRIEAAAKRVQTEPPAKKQKTR